MNQVEKDILQVHRENGFICPFCDVKCDLIKDNEIELEWKCSKCKEMMKITIK